MFSLSEIIFSPENHLACGEHTKHYIAKITQLTKISCLPIKMNG